MRNGNAGNETEPGHILAVKVEERGPMCFALVTSDEIASRPHIVEGCMRGCQTDLV